MRKEINILETLNFFRNTVSDLVLSSYFKLKKENATVPMEERIANKSKPW
jgi:hypothetical protein